MLDNISPSATLEFTCEDGGTISQMLGTVSKVEINSNMNYEKGYKKLQRKCSQLQEENKKLSKALVNMCLKK